MQLLIISINDQSNQDFFHYFYYCLVNAFAKNSWRFKKIFTLQLYKTNKKQHMLILEKEPEKI